MTRPKIVTTRKQRRKYGVFLRDGFKCVYCGCATVEQLTMDHVLPKKHGGKDRKSNLVTACSRCNQRKGDKLTPLSEKARPR